MLHNINIYINIYIRSHFGSSVMPHTSAALGDRRVWRCAEGGFSLCVSLCVCACWRLGRSAPSCLACVALGWLCFWPVPAHTRVGPWWLAFGSWVSWGPLPALPSYVVATLAPTVSFRIIAFPLAPFSFCLTIAGFWLHC